MWIGLLLLVVLVCCADTKAVNECAEATEETEEQVIEETEEQVIEETEEQVIDIEEIKKQVIEEIKEKVIIPDFIDGEIGEEIPFANRYGDFIFKVNNVYLTDDRNQFEDPVNYVVIIKYSVTNINIATEDFYFDLEDDAKFYDVNGYECKTYSTTVVDTSGIHNISPNRSSSSAVAIGITCDKPYLEMEFGGILYKFNL